MREEYAEGGGQYRESATFSMQVAQQRVETQGRVLEPCTLQYGNRQFTPNGSGSWMLRDVSFHEPSSCPGWAIVMCTGGHDRRDENVDAFVETLYKVAAERSMNLGRLVDRLPVDAYEVIRRGSGLEHFLTDTVGRLQQQSGIQIGLLLCVMSDTPGENGKYTYPALKRWSHTISGIPVQCCQVTKAMKVGDKRSKRMANDPQYAAGLLLKMNLKMGGENCHAITPTPRGCGGPQAGIALMQQVAEGTMVVGLDVHHASPGSQGASFAAVVASMDMQCVKFRTIVTMQDMVDDPRGGSRKQRQEIVRTLGETMVILLREFVSANCFGTKRPPRRIIFFRDGVAHNQFEAVAGEEITAITDACRAVCGQAVPQLVFILTQMRTKVRTPLAG